MYSELKMDNLNKTEEWRPMPELEHGFDISNFGRVRNRRTGRIHKCAPNVKAGGHWRTACWDFRTKRYRNFTIHRAVYRAFVGEVPEGLIVCHNDDDPANNHVSNLRADTWTGNQLDRIKFWKLRRDRCNNHCTLNKDQVYEIRAACARGEKQKTLAKQYGVDPSQISTIHCRKSWAWLPEIAS
jgi:hypothetical protein